VEVKGVGGCATDVLEEVIRGFLPIRSSGVGEESEDPSAVCVYLVVNRICRPRVKDRPYLYCRKDCEEFAHEGGGGRYGGVSLNADGDSGGVEPRNAVRLDDHRPREVTGGSKVEEGGDGVWGGSVRSIREIGSCSESLLVLMKVKRAWKLSSKW
jgi:hypothetical protein